MHKLHINNMNEQIIPLVPVSKIPVKYGKNPTGIIIALYITVCKAVNFVGPLSPGNSLNPAMV